MPGSMRSATNTRQWNAAFFSNDSHGDFASKRKVVDGEDEALKLIKVCIFPQFYISSITQFPLGKLSTFNLTIWLICKIQDHVESNRIMLYMKGNPSMPMCGFSARVVKILQDESVDFSSVNVLDYPSIREGVKKFS